MRQKNLFKITLILYFSFSLLMLVQAEEAEKTIIDRPLSYQLEEYSSPSQSIPFFIPEDTTTATITVRWQCKLPKNAKSYFRILSNKKTPVFPEITNPGESSGNFEAKRGTIYYLEGFTTTKNGLQGSVKFNAPYLYHGTRYELNLTGTDANYQLYLPSNQLKPGFYQRNSGTYFNLSKETKPLPYPIRVYWELMVEECPDGKNIKSPSLNILIKNSNLPPQIGVSEEFYGSTRFGSFLLLSNNTMSIAVNTGSWEKSGFLGKNQLNPFKCRCRISYRRADQDLPPYLCHVETNLVNQYVNQAIENQIPKLKAALLNENLYDLDLRSIAFDINTGSATVDFTAYYQGKNLGIPYKTEATGRMSFEILLSDDYSQIGVLCHGLVGSFDIAKDSGLFDAWGRNYINKMVAEKEFWTGKKPPAGYKIFKNSNLTKLVNTALIRMQLKPFEQEFLGGMIKAEYKDLSFNSFNLSTGQARLHCRIALQIRLFSHEIFSFEKAGRVNRLDLDFYTDQNQEDWLARLSNLDLSLSGLPFKFNNTVSEIIEKRFREQNPLIPINLPKNINPAKKATPPKR